MPVKKQSEIKSYKHKDKKRLKIPTEQEEQEFSSKDEGVNTHKPNVEIKKDEIKLNWKREVDLENYVEKSYPLFIHEKIHPQSFIQSLTTPTPPPPRIQLR